MMRIQRAKTANAGGAINNGQQIGGLAEEAFPSDLGGVAEMRGCSKRGAETAKDAR